MSGLRYVRPVATHRDSSKKLLLLDDDSRWFLWHGVENHSPVEIPESLARYLLARPELVPLKVPRIWLAVDDLPVRETSGFETDQPEAGHAL